MFSWLKKLHKRVLRSHLGGSALPIPNTTNVEPPSISICEHCDRLEKGCPDFNVYMTYCSAFTFPNLMPEYKSMEVDERRFEAIRFWHITKDYQYLITQRENIIQTLFEFIQNRRDHGH